MEKTPLEDNFEDIVSKAQVGYQISLSELAEKSGVPTQTIQAIKSGKLDASALGAIAPHLNLDAPSLMRIAEQAWYPEITTYPNVERFNTPFPMSGYEDMTVNAYVVADPSSKDCIVFDSGTDASPIVEYIEQAHLNLRAILLTHTHRDHIHDLKTLQKLKSNPSVYVNKHEPVENAHLFGHGEHFKFGSIECVARQTSGHSAGGTTFVIQQTDACTVPIAIVGDAIFAGSVGGAPKRMQEAVTHIRDKVLALPANTLLCPGHGPMTTVAEEQKNNPFFATAT